MKFSFLKSRMGRVGLFAFFMLLVLLADVVLFFKRPLLPMGAPPVVFSLEPGMPFWRVAYGLNEQGVIRRPLYWMAAVLLEKNAYHLKVGDYRISPELTPLSLLENMVKGKVILYSITIPEGWTFSQMRLRIDQNGYLKHVLAAVPENEVMAKLALPGLAEGHFFPSTYFFGRWTPDKAVYKKAHQTMSSRLEREWSERDPTIPYKTPEEALIVASLIEKEAAVDEERPIISGVIINRLHKKMLLQIDASVIYGLKNQYHGRLTREALHIDTPYNTYLHKGLPPTPICLPGGASLHAAMHPQATKALFYVAKGDGTHEFSQTLQQHSRAVNRYIKSKMPTQDETEFG